MNYANIKYYDIANGPGTRTSLFVSGCRVHCPGCFNQVTWPFDYGEPFDEKVQQQVLDSLAPSYIHGITILGGEPMEPENQHGLLPFLRRVRATYPQKSIWSFTGYTYDIVRWGRKHTDVTEELFDLIDVLVDGPFIQDDHDVNLRFRGSRNQRIIDLAATLERERQALAAGEDPRGIEPVLWTDDPVFSSHTMD